MEYFANDNHSCSAISTRLRRGFAKQVVIASRQAHSELRPEMVGHPPDTLKAIVTEAISKACGSNITADFVAMKCLKPGRPNPTHRYDHVVV
jgi:hypothetical protein